MQSNVDMIVVAFDSTGKVLMSTAFRVKREDDVVFLSLQSSYGRNNCAL